MGRGSQISKTKTRGPDKRATSASSANEDMQTFLESISSMRSLNKPKGFYYGSAEELVLKEGKSFTGTLRDDYPKGPPKSCFHTSFDLAKKFPELSYTEGYAMHFFPVHHAWLVDENGEVFDPTWNFKSKEEAEETDYLGISFDIKEVKIAFKGRSFISMLDNFEAGHPLLKEKFKNL